MLFIQVSQARNLPLNTSGSRQVRSISVASPCLLRIFSVSAPYLLRTISVPITYGDSTDLVRSRYGPD